MKKVLSVVLIISISLCFLVFAIENNAYNKRYYIKSYEKYNIERETGKSIEELSIISEDIILYLKGRGGDELLTPYFNEREVLHMRDVQNLFDMARFFKYTGITMSLLIIFYLLYKRDYIYLGKTLLYGPVILYIVLIVLGVLASTDFNKYFTYFHLIFFTNDLWLLDPNTDLMIQMLPEGFFMGMALKIVLSLFIYLSIIQIVGYLYKRKDKQEYEKSNNQTKRNIFTKQ